MGLTIGKAYELNIDISDSLDPISKSDFQIDLASDNHTGKWKVLNKRKGIISVRFMAQNSGKYILSIAVDGEEVGGEALEVSFGQKDEHPSNSNLANESPLHSRHRFKSGQSNESSVSYQPVIQ